MLRINTTKIKFSQLKSFRYQHSNTHDPAKFRVEKDSFGSVQIPIGKYWGIQTQRTLQNFKVMPNEVIPPSFIRAYAVIKRSAAIVNSTKFGLDPKITRAIIQACDEVISFKLIDHFPLSFWQSGSGTQTNMNLNEVIANRANEILKAEQSSVSVHPNDHVNRSQSTNDTFPTAMNVVAASELINNLMPNLELLCTELHLKEAEFQDLIKVGRTHLQDATPLSLGQEFSGYARQIELGMERLRDSCKRLYYLPIGGTAVGTGINTYEGYDQYMCDEISLATGLPFAPSPNKFEGQAAHDAIIEAHGQLNTIACSLFKIANDIRFLASGPLCGLDEIKLPANEQGSSIMPGKVNPTQCEMMTMICAQIFGNNGAITMGCSQGHFELNAFKPLIIRNFLQSVILLSNGIRSFTENCVKGIKPNKAKLQYFLDNSLSPVTALNQVIGYDNAAIVAKKSLKENKSIQDSLLELDLLTEAQIADLKYDLMPQHMINPRPFKE
jgi:fumarate hydratase class II